MSSVDARFVGEEWSISLDDVPISISELQIQCRAYVAQSPERSDEDALPDIVSFYA